MKVAFTGAGGTGKSTMAMWLAEQYGIPYVGSVGREAFKQMGIENEAAQENMSEQQLLALQWLIFQLLQEKRSQHKHYVTDRLLFDNYVYGMRRCGNIVTEEQRKDWEDRSVEDLWSFDLVFYCPTGLFKTEADGMRVAAPGYQSLIDSAIYGLLCKHAFDRMAGHVYVLNMVDQRRKDWVKRLCDSVAEVSGIESPESGSL
jgi:nicotinamide riboside kinase